MTEFKAWPKIPRGGDGEQVTITEKIDGTNACVVINEGVIVGVQSRKRLITPEDDNYGFASWVDKNTQSLLSLGDGYHYGEWAGPDIQKNPLELEKKTLYLFNSFRWGAHNPNTPDICSVVPILYRGEIQDDSIEVCMKSLKSQDTVREGIIVFYMKTKRYEKYTFANSKGKWSECI